VPGLGEPPDQRSGILGGERGRAALYRSRVQSLLGGDLARGRPAVDTGTVIMMTLAEIPQCCSAKFPTSGLRGMLGR
jgi:hypothetical protein